jgi:hypothetical protein
MAWFTLELWKVLEIEEDPGLDQPLDGTPVPGTGRRIGLGFYPVPASWTDADRDGLNRKILDHYWSREIGSETIALFKLRLMRRLNEIMPLYVQLYDSARLKFDPLSTFDLSTLRSDETNESVRRGSTSNATGTSSGKSRTVTSSPPQNQLSANGQYATNIVDATSGGTSENDASSLDTTAGDSTVKGSSSTTGRQGSANRLLAEYRSNILNIDLMVLSDLDELFMGVWDNNEELLPERGAYY